MTVSYHSVAGICGSVGSTTGGGSLQPSAGSIGDQNIAWMTVNGPSLTLKSTWNIGDTYSDANGSSGWFWVPNLGVYCDMVVDWGGTSRAWHGQAVAFSGADYVPFRTKNKAHGTASPITIASLTSTLSSSIMFAIEGIFSNSQVIGVPTHYTNIAAYNDSFGSDQISYETLGAAGSAADAISSTISAANWNSFGVEVVGNVANSYAYPYGVSALTNSSGTSVAVSNMTTVSGDFMIAFVSVNAGGLTISISGAGWSILKQDSTNGLTVAIATCTATGALTNGPTFSWTGSNSFIAEMYGYRNVNTAGTPVNSSVNVASGSSTTATITGFTTTKNESLVLQLGFSNTSNMFSQNPDYYVEGVYSIGAMSYSLQDARVANSGTTTPTYSQGFVAGTSQNWKLFQLELFTSGNVGTGNLALGRLAISGSATLSGSVAKLNLGRLAILGQGGGVSPSTNYNSWWSSGP